MRIGFPEPHVAWRHVLGVVARLRSLRSLAFFAARAATMPPDVFRLIPSLIELEDDSSPESSTADACTGLEKEVNSDERSFAAGLGGRRG